MCVKAAIDPLLAIENDSLLSREEEIACGGAGEHLVVIRKNEEIGQPRYAVDGRDECV